jgi:hypothetical protein
VQRAVDAGASIEALRAATELCGAFNVINRIADALDFEIVDKASFAKAARMLVRVGYR